MILELRPSMDLDVDDESIDLLTSLGEHLISSILEYKSFETIQSLVDSGAPVWYQSEDEGISPLHAATYVQDAALVKYLIENGAIWNAVDNLNHSAGDIALSFNNTEIYTLIRDAGIRSELVLAMLCSGDSAESTTGIVLQTKDDTAAGSSTAFLSSKLRFTKDTLGQDVCYVDAGGQEVGVMMGWERKIMQETVQKLCQDHQNVQHLKVLNIGFGLGIIDGLFQALTPTPALHVIIEPHPDVLQHMRDLGYYERPGVKILEGKWQDFIENDEILGIGGFDIVYTDTFSEDYNDLRKLFESLPNLLAGPDSRFSFFNGLGATNLLFYDVYTHIAELHLAEVGLDLQWSEVDVTEEDGENNRWGQSRAYFTVPLYRLPIGMMSLYIYDRHCICVYYQDWHRTKRLKPAVEGGILPAVSRAATPTPSNTGADGGGGSTAQTYSSPRNALSSSTGIVVAMNEMNLQPPASGTTPPAQPSASSYQHGLPFDEEAKLVYGVVLSLRNMIRKISGREEQFVNYRTSTYKLHLFETISGYKLVMLSDPDANSLRPVLHQIYAGPFIEFVVRNPLSTMDSRTHGIDNEYFRASIDRYVRGLPVFS